MSDKYKQINEARRFLNLPEEASRNEIKKTFNDLIKVYHPDLCEADKDLCKEKAEKLIESYKIIMEYCNNYKFSFKQDEVEKYLSRDEWWLSRFGDDPIWHG